MYKYLLLLYFFLLPFLLYSQGCCLEANKVTLCYTAEDDFCTFNSCAYTYDARNMRGISMKIDNKDNFGPQGVSCEIITKSIGNITTVEEIEALGCRIVFIGHFAEDNNAGFGTTIPTSFLSTVKEWSVKCKENLVILFQDEAELWGYSITNDNINPNVPGGSDQKDIFNGPFGTIIAFDQGGSFQANFTELAPTGAEILAVDGNNRPTVVLDTETNDLILADVGILCNGPGDISVSPFLTNNNDILACNILATSCEISTTFETEETIELCQSGVHLLPDSTEVRDAGTYKTILKSINDCDSVITTQIEILPADTTIVSYRGCESDSFSIKVGTRVYDSNYPSGIEMLVTEFGCDSFVEVDLVINKESASSFDSIFCSYEPFNFNGLMIDENIDTTIIIENAMGCDSAIDLSVEIRLFQASIIETSIVARNGLPYQFDNVISNVFDINWEDLPGLSCYDCPNPVVTLNEKVDAYNLTLTSPEGCIENYTIDVEYICEPYIPNIMNVSSVNGDELFGPMGTCSVEGYNFIIYDRWGGVVFESDEQSDKWRGASSGRAYETGVYVYKLDYTKDNTSKTISGMVHLIR